MVDLPATLTDRAAFLLRLVLNRAEYMGEDALAELGLSGREYGLVALLENGPPSAQHQLGAALGIDRTTTVALLGQLEARGLVTRSPDPANRRAYQVTLTAAGDRLRRRAAAVLEDCDDRFLEPLSSTERDRLRRLLRSLLGAVD